MEGERGGRINLMEVRQINKQSIVRILQGRGPMTKREITEALGLSLATIVTIIQELTKEGLVEQGEELASTGGRKPVVYRIVPDARAALGIALGACHVRMALVSWTQEILRSCCEEIRYEDTEEYWEHVRVTAERLLQDAGLPMGSFNGINFSLAGRIIPEGGYDDIIPEGVFAGLDMEKVREMYDCPVCFCDSIKAAAYSNIGTVADRNTCVYVHFGHTVGGALISEGTFWGLSNRTGEFGHMYLGKNGRVCRCGNEGCLQTYCSSEALREECGMDTDEFFRRVDAGEPAALAVWQRYLENFTRAVYNLRVIFDIDVMIGGEMAPYLRRRADEIQEALWALDIYGERKDYLRFSAGGEYDGAIGAALMLMQRDC